jgi:branched-chain amino acid transport system permease protein
MRLPSGTYNVSYEKDMAIIRTRTQWSIFILFILFLFLLPLIPGIGSRYVLGMVNMALIWVVAVLGLAILTGFCGQISLGQAAFMACGAYTSAILMTHLNISFWLSMPIAILLTALIGLFFGLPALRLKGLYLLMTSLAAQYIITYIILHIPALTHGGEGMKVPLAHLGDFAIVSATSNYYLILINAILATFVAVNIGRSQIGRAFVAIRDNDIAAEVMGVDITKYKLMAFAIGCGFAGWAGALSANNSQVISVEQFTLMHSLWFIGALIVGGMGSVLGTILGVMFIRILFEGSATLAPVMARMLAGEASIGSIGQLVFGLAVILFLIFEPRGLNHRWQILKAYYRLFPFSH